MVGLGDEELRGVDAEARGVGGVEGVLGVDEDGVAAGALGLGDGVEGEGGLARGLRAEDLCLLFVLLCCCSGLFRSCLCRVLGRVRAGAASCAPKTRPPSPNIRPFNPNIPPPLRPPKPPRRPKKRTSTMRPLG